MGKGDRRGAQTKSELLLSDLVNAYIAATGGGAGATEATQQLVLSAIQNGSEFEAKLVQDAINVTWLEVRTWNTESGTWNPPLYYSPGSNTPGTPAAPITYINPSALLALIETNTSGTNTKLTGAERPLSVVGDIGTGSTVAGKQAVTITFLDASDATLGGVAVPQGFYQTFEPLKGEDTVGSIAYNAGTGGRVIISYVNS